MNLVDTSGWIEYFFAGPNAAYFAQPIEDAKHLLVPTVCLYEVFKKVNLVGNHAQALHAVAQMREAEVVTLTDNVALSAALVSLKYGLPMADSMIYATALAWQSTLWTQDDHFARLPGVNFKKASASTPGAQPPSVN